MHTNLAKAHLLDSVTRGKLGVVVSVSSLIASAFAPVTVTNSVTMNIEAVSEMKTAGANADAVAVKESWSPSTSPSTSLPYNDSYNQTT